MLLHRPIECLLYLRFGAGIDDDDLDPDAAAGGHEGFCIGDVRILGIDQYGNDRRPGVQQPEQLDALRSKLAVDEGAVTLPPGRLRLATSPFSTGSLPLANTIGMLVVATLAASAETTLPVAKMASTGRLTSSAASAGSRSY